MKKEEIIAIFETDFSNPGSVKSGEYLEDHVLTHAQEIVKANRGALIEILADWLAMRTEPQTMLAVKIAGVLCVRELRNALLKLRDDVAVGRAFLPFYTKRIDAALRDMNPRANQ
ncbi:MAG: hypothetical protein WC076_09860 [Terrimicrobiaceae bacterium]|nr:hypothetical protein [Terrimicrobiaceae bacterium]